MKTTFQKLLRLSLSEKLLTILAGLALLLALIPLYRLALYAFPRYDDYNYGQWMRNFLQLEFSLPSALEGIRYSVKTNWWAWQGTFSSIFMMSAMPDGIRPGLYFVGLWLILTVFVAGSLSLCGTLARYVLKADLWESLLLGIIVTFTLLEPIYTAQQGLFWYNSAVHYTFMHGVLFCMLAAAIRLLYTRWLLSGIICCVLTTLLGIVCSGANFVTCLQGILLLAGLFLLGLLARNRRTFFLLPVILVYGNGLRYNMIAPGNSVRSAHFQGMDPVSAILHSFGAAGRYAWRFSGVVTLLMMLLALPLLYRLVQKTEHFRFPAPALVLLLSFCFYATGFTPSYYAMGSEGLARTLVVVKFDWQLLLFLNETYLLGYLTHRERFLSLLTKLPPMKHYLCYYAAIAVMMGIFFVATDDRLANFSSFGAYYYVHTGEANNLHEEYLQRVETIRSSGSEVALEPYHFMPWYLINRDLSDSPSAEENSMMARWYGKDALYVVYPDAEE